MARWASRYHNGLPEFSQVRNMADGVPGLSRSLGRSPTVPSVVSTAGVLPEESMAGRADAKSPAAGMEIVGSTEFACGMSVSRPPPPPRGGSEHFFVVLVQQVPLLGHLARRSYPQPAHSCSAGDLTAPDGPLPTCRESPRRYSSSGIPREQQGAGDTANSKVERETVTAGVHSGKLASPR